MISEDLLDNHISSIHIVLIPSFSTNATPNSGRTKV